jgi:hypothetical protein
MNKTEKDFQREITRVKQSFMDDQLNYNLPFKFEQTETEMYHTYIISNPKSSAVITLDKTFGYMNTTRIGRYQLEKCLQMQNEVEKGQL